MIGGMYVRVCAGVPIWLRGRGVGQRGSRRSRGRRRRTKSRRGEYDEESRRRRKRRQSWRRSNVGGWSSVPTPNLLARPPPRAPKYYQLQLTHIVAWFGLVWAGTYNPPPPHTFSMVTWRLATALVVEASSSRSRRRASSRAASRPEAEAVAAARRDSWEGGRRRVRVYIICVCVCVCVEKRNESPPKCVCVGGGAAQASERR